MIFHVYASDIQSVTYSCFVVKVCKVASHVN